MYGTWNEIFMLMPWVHLTSICSSTFADIEPRALNIETVHFKLYNICQFFPGILVLISLQCYYLETRFILDYTRTLGNVGGTADPCALKWSVNSSLQWRHNGLDDVSNYQRLDCLLTRLLGRRSKLRGAGLCEWNSPVTGEFPSERASNAKNISIWWRMMCKCWWGTWIHTLQDLGHFASDECIFYAVHIVDVMSCM